jgi:hypothetical protein
LVPWEIHFHDAEAPGSDLIDHTKIKQDDAIGYIFLQALSGEGTFSLSPVMMVRLPFSHLNIA